MVVAAAAVAVVVVVVLVGLPGMELAAAHQSPPPFPLRPHL